MTLLIVNLHDKNASSEVQTLDWALFDEAGERQQGNYQVALESFDIAGKVGEQMSCLLIVPAHQVLIAQVQVPTKQRRHLQKFLPFLVEEVIAEPIEDMHLVLSHLAADGTAEVLAVNHSKMKSWLDQCDQLNIAPHWLTPATSVITCAPDELVVYLDENEVLIKSARVSLKAPVSNLPSLIELIAADKDTQPGLSQVSLVSTQAYAEKQATQLNALQSQFESEGKSVVLEISPSLFDYLCEQVCHQILKPANPNFVNLLTAAYQPTLKRNSLGSWRLLGYAAAVCVGLQILFNVGIGLYLENKGRAVEQQVIQRYRELFPQDGKIVDVKIQMRNHLEQALEFDSETDFLQLLGGVGYQIQAMNQPQSLQIQQVRYDERQNSLMLDIDVRQIQQLDQFKQELSERGLAVTILSATEEQQWVKGRLRIDREA